MTILQVCAAGIVLAYVTISTAFALGSVLLLMAGRVLGGATGGSRAISMAALADVCSPKNKDFWLSMGLLASSGGFVIGSALSGLLANNQIVSWFTIHTPLHTTVLLASLDFVSAFVVISGVSETPLCAAVAAFVGQRVFSLVSAFRGRGLREVSWVFLLQSLARGAYFFSSPISSWIPSM